MIVDNLGLQFSLDNWIAWIMIINFIKNKYLEKIIVMDARSKIRNPTHGSK